jgi:hypothetical protein
LKGHLELKEKENKGLKMEIETLKQFIKESRKVPLL